MIQRQGEYNGTEYTLERYDCIDEFLTTIESRPLHDNYEWKSKDLRQPEYCSYDIEFKSVKGYDDARTKFVEGTKATAEMSKAYRSMETSRERKSVNSVRGCAPIVAKALMGMPDSMIDIRRKRVPKTVKVVVNMSISGGISAWEITEAGKKIIAAVGRLENEGIATEIICTADKFLEGKQLSSCGVTIKNAGQGFNAARVSFSMSSPAFLRVFQWLQLATNPHAIFDSGYGSNVAYMWSGKTLDDYYRTMYGNGIYISLPNVVKRGQSEIDRAINEWRR